MQPIQQQLIDIQDAVSQVLDFAKTAGATAAEVSMSKVQGISVTARMQDVETVEFTNDGGLGIAVYVGQQKGSASTSDLSPEALKLTVEKAVAIAKHTENDICNGLADADLMASEIVDCDTNTIRLSSIRNKLYRLHLRRKSSTRSL